MLPRIAVVSLVLVSGACGVSHVGASCTSDSDCGSGPKCLVDFSPTDAGSCTSQTNCWYPCTADADCAGTKFGSIDTPKCATAGPPGCPTPPSGICGPAF